MAIVWGQGHWWSNPWWSNVMYVGLDSRSMTEVVIMEVCIDSE